MLRNVRLLYVHNFLTDFLPQWPFLVIYYAGITGSYTTAMSVVALDIFSSALFDIPTGVFSDRLGRRLTMAIGSFSYMAGTFCYAFAADIRMLYAGAILWGLGRCLFSGNNNALLYESLQSEGLESDYHHYRGATGSMFQLALCSSALLSMWLSHYGLRTVFVTAIVPQVMAIAVSLMFKEPHQHQTAKPKGLAIFKQACIKTWKNPHLAKLVLARALNYGSDEAKYNFQTVFVGTLWPIWAIGFYRAIGHAGSFLGYRYAARLIERFGEPVLFITRDICWFMSAAIAVATNCVASPVILKLDSFLFGPGEVASDHLMQKEFTDDERATMGSISSFATSVVYGLAAIAIGLIADGVGTRAAILAGAAMAATSLPINVQLFLHRKKA